MALYRGRASEQAWRKDARIKAYSNFIESVFTFDKSIEDLDVLGPGEHIQAFNACAEAVDKVALARATVVVVGPHSLQGGA